MPDGIASIVLFARKHFYRCLRRKTEAELRLRLVFNPSCLSKLMAQTICDREARAGSARIRSQPAMEFLMTYGWSILIITVVVAALFQLGVFSPTNYTPKAQPGNCKVLRTGGFTNLEGTCSGVPPQSVAVFNGGSSYVTLPSGSSITTLPNNAITISAWIYPTVAGKQQDIIDEGYQTSNTGYEFGQSSSASSTLTFRYNTNSLAFGYVTSALPGLTMNVWQQVAATYNGQYVNFYENGASLGSVAASGNVYAATTTPVIGSYSSEATFFFQGDIANVQIYNTTLDASQIQLLYTRGIGAAPIAPQYVVGWWPLNGNPNDYSGNNNNGAPTNIVYTSSWTGGYTAP
jgi:hypothetical protein